MATALPPSGKPAPPPAKPASRPSPTNTQSPVSTRDFKIESGTKAGAEKVVLFSSGGAGKTSLAALTKDCGIVPLFLDLEQGSARCDVSRIDTIQTWDELRAILHNHELLAPFNAVVIDSLTKAEELATTWTLQNVKHEKGHYVQNGIEGYGFGRGYTHVFETFLQLLADLDAVARRGLHVICTAHECVANVPNPSGEDWIRYEPRLQSPPSGKGSIRHRVKEWCDHLLYIGFDTAVEDGKASGIGTRTIYPTEMPAWWAKSRSLSEPIPYIKGDGELWKQLFAVK